MKGDFSRDTFRPEAHFSRVLLQQGRVLLDADFNEQSDILLHYMRAVVADLFGSHCAVGAGFQIALGEFFEPGNFLIKQGHFYVDGILCENDADVTFTSQPHYRPEHLQSPANTNYLIYLDVWERHVSADEIDNLREVALGGVDTTTRAQVVWQVKTIQVKTIQVEDDKLKVEDDKLKVEDDKLKVKDDKKVEDDKLKEISKAIHAIILPNNEKTSDPKKDLRDKCEDYLKSLTLTRGTLSAMTLLPKDEADSANSCALHPDSGYRGMENQLYRVEIHRSVVASPEEAGGKSANSATFKWSRDNGSCLFPIYCNDQGEPQVDINPSATTTTATVVIDCLGCRESMPLSTGDWVELIDDDYTLAGMPEPLWCIDAIDEPDAQGMTTVHLSRRSANTTPTGQTVGGHPLLRRWDHKAPFDQADSSFDQADGALVVIEDQDIELEQGVCVQFSSTKDASYQFGDYWLIPARTQTGDVEWPPEQDKQGRPKHDKDGNLIPKALPPHRIEHHYAPLAVWIGEQSSIVDCRS